MKLKIALDRQAETPLNRQLYDAFTRLILSGSLKAGDKIPSTRDLSDELGISRPTVTACLDQLSQEGYVEIRPGSGTYVSPQLKEKALKSTVKPSAYYALSDYGEFVSKMPPSTLPDGEPDISFYCWRPALDQFPLAEWARVVGRHARDSDVTILDTSLHPEGTLELREALAGLVKRFRAVSCTPDQVIPVMGLNQGLDLVARLHLDASSNVVVEDPGFTPVAFKASGAKLISVSVDEQGLRTDKLPGAKWGQIDLTYLTPARQFPTGAVMPLSRRLEFLDWARREATLVLEDDYDSEYQSSGRPIPALMSLDKDQRVIYLGTLNQLMFPSLALGYLIVPPRLVSLYKRARGLSGEQLPPHMQVAVADFINEGHLDRHVKKLRSLYRSRRRVLVEELSKRFGDTVAIGPSTGGVFVLVRFKTHLTEEEIQERAGRAGVGLTSTKPFYARKTATPEFILGFGSLDETQIKEGIKKLASALT